ncbi:hypothetical protein ACFOMD_03580 [Sphingoaurantiacus capsulatus]|uniref:Uncharacterized protein n=1 Tax=Sphingoaurantiacus capsulatus TaxID=1771310 RepID=A0ABV7X6S2_9SPHN
MDFQTTVTLMLFAAALVGGSLWGTRRKVKRLGDVSYVPWNGLMFLGILVFCVLAAHLVTLMTGVPLKGNIR